MLFLRVGRRGPKPLLIKLPSLKEEVTHLANRLKEANCPGMPWNDMAVPYRHYAIGKEVADTLARMGVPFQWQQDKKQKFEPLHDSVKLITLHSSKGLEFPLVCMPAIGGPTDEEQVLEDEACLLYLAMARATQELVMTHHEESVLGEKVWRAMRG